MSINRYSQSDFSGGVQSATSFLMKKPNELNDVRNGRFGVELGAVVRRNGHDRVGSTFGAGGQNTPTAGYIAKFTTGNKRFVAVNNSGSTATIIRVQDSGTGAWSTISGTTIPVNAKVFFFLYLDEVYVTGYDPATGDPITPYNIDNTLNLSTTRNILNMPTAYYLAEFNGALYAANAKVGSTRYPNRAYKSSGPLGAITFVQAAQTGAITYITVDSVRYLKASMNIDIYTGGTSTKIYDIAITSVDKVNNRIYFTPVTINFATTAVNTATEEITLSSTASFPTGTPCIITSTTTVPAGLTAGTTYYAINVSGTVIKLATSYANAIAGTAINITSQGTGTHTISLSYQLADNDEIWLDGRKDKLTMFWNTDYPTTEDSDWIATLPGTDSSNAITSIAKSSNRLFLFTKNSGQKYDGGNIVTFNNAVGCVSQNSLKNIDDDWLIWIDAKGRVWARNDTNGQQEFISRGIHEKIMKYITDDNLLASSGNVNDNNYYLYLGQNNVGQGNEYLRIVYSFNDNVWSIDRLPRQALFADNDDYTGENKPYFFCDDGYLYIDDSGDIDYDTAIPMTVNLGRDNLGTERLKKIDGLFIYSEKAAGTVINVIPSGERAYTVGTITNNEQYIKLPERGPERVPTRTSYEIVFSSNIQGEAPKIQGLVWHFVIEEDLPSERRATV